nr:M56 family metallopeptidase [Candidatus Delongbacteria bacterium]
MMNENIITSIVNALLHSLWQAPLIAILLYISIAGLKLRSKAKYVLSLLSLFIILAVSISTFIYFSNPHTNFSNISKDQAETSTIMNAPVNKVETSNIGRIFTTVEEYAEMIFVFWLTGMLIFLIKFGLDLYYANSIRKKEYTEVNQILLHRFKSIAEKMGVKKSIKFLESSLIKVPVVIGHLKPVILLPLGLVTKIPKDQIEAIISHELAHIMRNDFLHNLIQSVVEIIYFFNPAIYFISKQIRTERENCCDDLALEYCSDCANLAKGLYNLQNMRGNVPKPIMAAINKGDLLSRIKRIIGKEKDMKNSYTGFIASIIVMALAVTFITGCSLFAGAKDDIKTEEANVIIVKKSSDGQKTITITFEGDSNIVDLSGLASLAELAKLSDLEGLSGLADLAELADIDFDFDFDIDIDFDEIAESLEEALEEIDKKEITDKEKAEAKAEVKEAIK